MSLRKFVYNNSIYCYNQKDSSNYCPFDYPSDIFLNEEARLRQMRHRLLSKRVVYDKQPEWSAMRASSEHEWAFYYVLDKLEEEKELLFDVYKRIGNLYNDINKELSASGCAYYQDRRQKVYKRFLSKLKKIDYERFLQLQQKILSHICEDKKYYGMNIYRFEKLLRLFNITSEVTRLVECREEEEKQIIEKSIILNGIHFPKLYQSFGSFDDSAYTATYAAVYYAFRDNVVFFSRIIYDDLIEKGYFKNWESLSLDTINEMAERVFYNPEEIDYSIKPQSKEKFFKLLAAHAKNALAIE